LNQRRGPGAVSVVEAMERDELPRGRDFEHRATATDIASIASPTADGCPIQVSVETLKQTARVSTVGRVETFKYREGD
jgi:hypothetical protein